MNIGSSGSNIVGPFLGHAVAGSTSSEQGIAYTIVRKADGNVRRRSQPFDEGRFAASRRGSLDTVGLQNQWTNQPRPHHPPNPIPLAHDLAS